MKKPQFIKIPTNPKDLHNLKDLKDSYIAACNFQNNIEEYFLTIIDCHLKSVDELLAEIPQKNWKDYLMVDYKSDRLSEASKQKILKEKNVLIQHLSNMPRDIALLYTDARGYNYGIYTENMTLQEFYETSYQDFKNDMSEFTKIGFFIDHKCKKIKLYEEFYTGRYNYTFTLNPKFNFVENDKICMTSTKVWRSGTWRKPGDAEESTDTNYYFDVNSNTFVID